jgi:hypothetical protein
MLLEVVNEGEARQLPALPFAFDDALRRTHFRQI